MKQQHTLQPKLRFPEFEGHWIETKLKEITSLITKGTTPKSFYTQGINFVKLESLDGFNIDKRKFVYIDSETHNNELKRSKLKVNDILFAIAGATVGKVAYVKQDILPANTNQALAIIRLKENVNHNYILQILSSRQMKNYIYMNMSVGAQPNISLEQLNNFCYKSPSLPEQQKIADYLSTIDTKINLLEEKKAQLALYKKAMMQKLFSQEIRFKPSEAEALEAYPEWEEKRLGAISEINKGQQLNKENFIENGKFKVLNGGISYSGSTNNFNREGNIITISEGGNSCGYTNYVTERFWLGGHCYALDNLKYNIYDKFLFQYLKFNESNIMRLRVGSGLPNIQKGDLSKLCILMPFLPEQQKIADFLSAIDESIEKVTEQISQTQSFKKAMLQQMFV